MPEIESGILGLATKQVAAGATNRVAEPIRSIENLSKDNYYLLCKKDSYGKVSKRRVKLVIGPYPIKKPTFAWVKPDDEPQIQINLVVWGVKAYHDGHFSNRKWIEKDA